MHSFQDTKKHNSVLSKLFFEGDRIEFFPTHCHFRWCEYNNGSVNFAHKKLRIKKKPKKLTCESIYWLRTSLQLLYVTFIKNSVGTLQTRRYIAKMTTN